jgi:hypothetical protein
MAVAAEQSVGVTRRMREFVTGGIEFKQLLPRALCDNGVAGITVGGPQQLACCLVGMLSAMATKTTGPVFVANIVRIMGSDRRHQRKEVLII